MRLRVAASRTWVSGSILLVSLILTPNTAAALFINGGFETVSPPFDGWTKTWFQNTSGLIGDPPFDGNDITRPAGGSDQSIIVTGSAPESEIDSLLGPDACLRLPKYGLRCARVNGPAFGSNANTIKQQTTVTSADIDPTDGKIHVRFAYAPVFLDPGGGHHPYQRPYFYVGLRNLTQGNTVLYYRFAFASQQGIPWEQSPLNSNIRYTNWQIVDYAAEPSAVQEGDILELEAIAAGCSAGGAHWGYVYVDGFGAGSPGLAVTKTASPSPVVLGENVTYTFTYRNGAATTAENVIVKEVIPDCATYVSNSDPSTGGTCTYTAGALICDVGTLTANQSGTFSVTVTASGDARTCGSIENGNYSIEATGVCPTLGQIVATPILRPFLTVEKTAPATVLGGQNLTYTFTYENSGAVTATAVVATEAIPPCATWVSNSNPSTGGTCTYTAGSVVCDIGTLPPNTSGSFSVTVAASSAPTGCPTIENNAYSIAGTGHSPAPGELVSTYILQPKLEISKNASPSPVLAGQNLTYTFTYQNIGSATANGVVITETIPPCATYVSDTDPSTGGSCTFTPPDVVTCTGIPPLAPNNSGTFSVTVTASADVEGCSPIVNDNYAIAATGLAPVSGTAVSTTIQDIDLSVTKTAPATVQAGQNLTYTFTYQNDGSATANNVVVKETIPPCATWVSNTNPSTGGGACAFASGVVTCDVGTLPPSTSGTFTVTVAAPSDPACESMANGNYTIEGTYAPPVPGPLVSTAILAPPVWSSSWFHDAFPFNETLGLPGTSQFDTVTAMVKTGQNIARLTAGTDRLDIPADTLIIRSAGLYRRTDLVFRILPGPGNYMTVGDRSSPLRKLPCERPTGSAAPCAAPAAVNANSSSTNFWESYQANSGTFGTGGNGGSGVPHYYHGLGPYPPGTRWDPNHWNSARMDTAEVNLFLADDHSPNLNQLAMGTWASMYHESDPKFATLGIAKNRCFLIVPTSGSPVDESNITCGDGVYPPPWADANAGYSVEITGQPGMTHEYTKIIPDGLLTPGSHVQYFVRISDIIDPPQVFSMIPDTNFVYQTDEGSVDGHRWQQFGVLPDRWKATQFGGPGMACMLFLDLDDGHGDELAWVEAAEAIGATAASKRGAHNGWSRGAQFNADPNDPANFVRAHGGQPGSIWDMYGVRGVDAPLGGFAGSIGSRRSTTPIGSALNKGARIGPTLEMLITYYRVVYVLSGSVKDRLLGPYEDRSQHDLSMLQDYLATPSTDYPHATLNPRGLFIEGDSFVESNWTTPAHQAFLTNYLGVTYVAGDYSSYANNSDFCPTLDVGALVSPTVGFHCGIVRTTPGRDDVLGMSGLQGTLIASTYPNTSQNTNPKIASIYKGPSPPQQNWVALTDGWDIKRLTTLSCPPGNDTGRRKYLYDALKNLFLPLCERRYQVTGDFVSDNHVMLFTGPGQGPPWVPTYTGFRSCWPTPTSVNFTTTDRYLYLACWNDDAGGQGLLHDLAITSPTGTRNVFSGDPLWTVAPTDSNVDVGCGSPSPSAQIAASLASRVPGATFGAPALGCFNPPTGSNCYGIWGHVASIDPAARWTWFNSGSQGGANAPFQPGFNHREFLIFRLDMDATEFVTGIEPSEPAGVGFRITPNPSRSPIIAFVLQAPSMVELAIYDVSGRRIKNLHKGVLPAGQRSVQWSGEDENGSRVRPGVYFVRLKMGDAERRAAVVMLK